MKDHYPKETKNFVDWHWVFIHSFIHFCLISDRFIQAVKPNDLIMIYPAMPDAYPEDSAIMFVVLSAPADRDPHPITSSFTVRRINWDVPGRPGDWILNGPYVDYTPVEPGDDLDSSPFNYRSHPITFYEPASLKDILEAHASGAKQEPDQDCTGVWVNPHRRFAYSSRTGTISVYQEANVI